VTDLLRRVLLLAIVGAVAGACGGAPADRDRKEPVMTKAEAERRILAFIDETLTAAAPGKPRVPGPLDGNSEECTDAGGFNGTVARTYAREVPGLDEAAAAAAEQLVVDLWTGKGLKVDKHSGPPGLVDLQTTVDGIEFLVRVSRPGHRVSAAGTTPCLAPT
jgi:hypothetical protein